MKKTEENIEKLMNESEKIGQMIIEEIINAAEKRKIITNNETLEEILSKIRNVCLQKKMTVEEMKEKVLKIHKNVLDEIPHNVEVHLKNRLHVSGGDVRELEETIIRFWTKDSSESELVLLGENQIKDVSFFLGGDDVKGFLVTRDKEGNIEYTELQEFQLLSIAKKYKENAEYGIMTSFTWLNASLETTQIVAYNLIPLKNFFLADLFREITMMKGKDSYESK